MPQQPVIVWFRKDLRLEDNPALHAAAESGQPVIPTYIHEPAGEGKWPPGGASKVWLHESLNCLDESLKTAGSRLILRSGDSLEVLRDLVRETKASTVHWNRRYEPDVRRRDDRLERELKAHGLEVSIENASLLFEPGTVQTKFGTPFKVFTPFYRACLAHAEPPIPQPAPKRITGPKTWPMSEPLADWNLLPRIPWDAGIRSAWKIGESAAKAKLDDFLERTLAGYLETRDRPDWAGSSRFSPHLHFGEIGPRQLWHAVRDRVPANPLEAPAGIEGYLRQLVWRDFAYQLLVHFPHTDTEPLDSKFARFPWQNDEESLRAWQRGQTGYPIVDAGLRQLWATGWMHNRVRMIAGSFLVKDLLIPWQRGAEWFWDTLVDADLANNTLGWQWIAGCGADAAPYFRIFNPVSQAEKFDPEGNYVRQWVPELAKLPAEWIHKPWEAPYMELAVAGVELGENYPRPMVDHDAARKRALERYQGFKTG